MSVPGNVNWIIDFLAGRQQMCRVQARLSAPVQSNRSIIQGLGLGPTLYIGMKSDMTAVSPNNHLIKYADDVNLIVPEISDVDIGTEFIHIKQWAIKNKMVIYSTNNQGDGFPLTQTMEHSLPCSFRWH